MTKIRISKPIDLQKMPGFSLIIVIWNLFEIWCLLFGGILIDPINNFKTKPYSGKRAIISWQPAWAEHSI